MKLFGNYDTFTNDKLRRRMSQFEGNHDDDPSQSEGTSGAFENVGNMCISHFGEGQLDRFTFDERVETQPPPLSSRQQGEVRIFGSSINHEENFRVSNVREGSNLEARGESQQATLPVKHDAVECKRELSSIKDRTPKRRRTLLHSDTGIPKENADPNATKSTSDANQLAVKKRKDAGYDGAELAADPATLASRQMLRPRPARQRSSGMFASQQADGLRPETAESEDKITELAAKLASFGTGVTQIVNDSRKPSVTTQDFLNEATKIMQIIRQRGKPRSGLSSVEEPRTETEINPDSILDLEVEGEDTTVDNFSRPPSRNGSIKKRRERMGPPDPSVVSHLQKYEEGDDLELLITSKLGSLHLLPEPHAEEAALVPLPDEDHKGQEVLSSPANIRIRESLEHMRKSKHSTSDFEGPPSLPTHASSGTSTRTTIPTNSSSSSGNKGRIPPGMVLVPEQVGVMTFDHSTKSWVRGSAPQVVSPSSRKSNSEEDPFGDIPDLSIDEQREVERNALSSAEAVEPRESLQYPAKEPAISSRPHTREDAQILHSETATATGGSKFTRLDSSPPVADTRATSWATVELQSRPKPQNDQTRTNEVVVDHHEEVEHEIRIHDGRLSEAPPSPDRSSKKARAVTIAFSSPVVSAIAYHNEHSLLEINHAGESDGSQEGGRHSLQDNQQDTPRRLQSFTNEQSRLPAGSRMFKGRPISRIDEQDEDDPGHELSLVHISQSNLMTPAQNNRMPPPVAKSKHASMICLTPLSEFSLHQNDQPRHLEASYVARRAHPTSLQQAHGSLALAVDDLMKAMTDAEPYELYWEHLRRLDLADKGLTSLHRLEEYCSAVEELHLSGNGVSQLNGVPVSVRTLLAQNNCLSSLTSWGHLHNLQYLDISRNGLESLDGLSCLAHLRELKANRNRIRNLEGILDLDALLYLELQSNELATVDFESAELTRLHHLDLSGNQLVEMRNASALPALQTLHVERNNLGEFGASDETFTMLHDLRLSLNQLEVINLDRFPSIQVLYLDNNRLHTIQGLGTARHLNTLSVREQSDSPNLLNTVFSTSSECRKLYLSSNPAPREGLKMPTLPHLNLKYLELASCGLTSLAFNFGGKIPNCRTLNLNFNAIKDLQPLKGCGRLNKLMMAGNRLNKLRRTCVALTRLPALTKIDLRDNPLTIGFYAPFRESRVIVHGGASTEVQDPYTLGSVDETFDSKWVTHLDEGTRMKRRTIELFLAKGCEKLLELDGLAFDRVVLLQQDEIWQKLACIGVISKASRTVSIRNDVDEEEALPLDAEGQ